MNGIPTDLTQHISTYLCVQDAVELRKTAKVFSSYGWDQWINSCVKNRELRSWTGLIPLAHAARSQKLNDALMDYDVTVYPYFTRVFHRNVPIVESLLEPWIAESHRNGYWIKEWLHFAAVHRLHNTCRLLIPRQKIGHARAHVDRVLAMTLSVGDFEASDLLWKSLSEEERRATKPESKVFVSLARPHVSLQVFRSALEWMKANQYVCYVNGMYLLELDEERRAIAVAIGNPQPQKYRRFRWQCMPLVLLNAGTN
jgi:hypothetical protein